MIREGLRVYAPDQVAAIRMSTAFLALLPLAITRLRELNRYKVKWLFLSGLQGNFLPAFLFAFAQTKLESSMAGILNALTPLFTLLIGVVLYSQRVSLLKVLGIVVGLSGCVWLILERNGGIQGQANGYALLVVAATVLYGSNVNLLKHKLQEVHPLVTSSVALLLVGPPSVLYLFSTDFAARTQYTPGAWQALGAVVLLGLLSTALALVLFNKLLQISNTLFASSVTYLMPVVSVAWGLVLHEQIGYVELLGMLTILTGVLIVHRAG
jgi:drug/metabolite transporter (DMT)-like permease